MNDSESLGGRFQQKHSGRNQATSLGMTYNQELFDASHELKIVNETLEARVAERTAELVAAHEGAIKASKAKSEFLSRMSHELRTPLNAILGFSQLMEDDENLTETQHNYISEVLKAGGHLLTLIDEVLDLSKIEAGKIDLLMEDVEPSNVLDECRMLTQPLALQNNISLSCESCSCSVRADRGRLKQVLLNLISNAIKYNRKGGSVEIACRSVSPNKISIQITDSGQGLSEAQQVAIFESFNRVGQENGSVEGTGIGLVIAKNFIELMGGMIGVKSTPGTGSTFWIELPDVTSGVGADEIADELLTGSIELVNAPATLLYIEGNPTNTRLIEQVIAKKTDCRLLTTSCSSTGLDLARAHQPDLIFLDINLPDMDGFEILRKLKKMPETSMIPVIAMSAYTQAKVVKHGLRAGFKGYLTKPVSVRELLETLEAHLPMELSCGEWI